MELQAFIKEIESIDQVITLWINSFNHPISDQIWIWFSDKLVWIPLYILVIGMLVKKLGWKKGLISVMGIVLCILCADQLCNLVKNSVMRLRPCNDQSIIDRGLHMLAGASTRHPYGFFSAHSANAMAFAAASVSLFGLTNLKHLQLWNYGLYSWACLVGISRVFVGKHFLGDVIVGLLVGYIIARIISALLKALFNSRASLA